jgi:hypothetical protein
MTNPAIGSRMRADCLVRSRRVVPLPHQVVEILKEHRVSQAADRLRLGAAWSDMDLVSRTRSEATGSRDAVVADPGRAAGTPGTCVILLGPRPRHSETAALQTLANDTGMELVQFVDATYSEFPAAVARHRPDIFHFIGTAGDVPMSDSTGGLHPVSAADLAMSLLAPTDRGVAGVVLNACYSGRAARS